jgi:hypothetical protein
MRMETLIAFAVLVPAIAAVATYNAWAIVVSGKRRISALLGGARREDSHEDQQSGRVRCARVDCRGDLCESPCC